MEGRLPETVLKGGAGSGVLRPRLVTAGSGGPGHRPPGTTTWLRGARCTDPEAMPEMEARPPAKNRHGGAPRGERPASWQINAPWRSTRLHRLKVTLCDISTFLYIAILRSRDLHSYIPDTGLTPVSPPCQSRAIPNSKRRPLDAA